MSNKSSFYFNQISKKGLLENDKKLLLNKFGFKNLHLSQANLNLDNINTINYSIIDNSLASIKNDNRKPIKACSIINLNINNNNNTKKITQIKNKTNQVNRGKSQNKIYPKNGRSKYGQSLASLSSNGLIFLNEKNEIHLCKSKNNISSANVTDTTAQNSMKTNIGLLSNTEMIKPIKKRKSKIKNDIKTKNCSSPNLFEKTSNSINLNKEKPYKVINNSTYLSKTNKKINTKKIVNNRNNDKNNKYNIIIDKKINKTVQNFYTKKNDDKNNDNIKENNIDNNINKIKEKEIKNNTEYNNSDNTKKESIKELHKIFDEKIMQNIDKKNLINDIIASNFEINQNNKTNSRNINQQNININEQITINIENNIELSRQESNNQIDFNNKNILLPHNDTQPDLEKHNKEISHKNKNQNKNELNHNENPKSNDDINEDNNIQNDSNYESILEEKDEKVAINNIRDNNEKKFTIFNENYEKDNDRENDNEYLNDKDNKSKDSSSIKTHENLYKHLNDLDNNNDIIKQDEQELQPDIDRQSEQTQTTLDKNYILSKFIKQPIYDISSRFLNEETINTKVILPNKKFLFIDDIEEKIKNMPVINLKKMLSLNNECFYNLISYSYDNYSNIISIHNLVKKKFQKSLKAKFQHIINDFRHKYGTFLNVLDFDFKQKKFNLNNKKNNPLNVLNLEIKCEIITQEINKSYEIGCNYTSNKKNYDNFWKFDVLDKNDIKLWICTELNKINNVHKKFTYTSQVSPFCYGDIIKLQFNIFSKDNIVDPKSIEWTEPTISLVPGGIYEKSKFISKYSFDQIRACEVETQILFWKNIMPKDAENIVNSVKRIYGKLFDIQNIRYDVSKFYFFKIEMKAKQIGLLKQNEFSDFDINIVSNKLNVENEIQCIYLMNSYYYTKKMDIRIGTKIILYIVDMNR